MDPCNVCATGFPENCERPCIGESSHCEVHNRQARRIYNEYKAATEKAERCLNDKEPKDPHKLFSFLLMIYSLFVRALDGRIRCRQMRKPSHRDFGHDWQIDVDIPGRMKVIEERMSKICLYGQRSHVDASVEEDTDVEVRESVVWKERAVNVKNQQEERLKKMAEEDALINEGIQARLIAEASWLKSCQELTASIWRNIFPLISHIVWEEDEDLLLKWDFETERSGNYREVFVGVYQVLGIMHKLQQGGLTRLSKVYNMQYWKDAIGTRTKFTGECTCFLQLTLDGSQCSYARYYIKEWADLYDRIKPGQFACFRWGWVHPPSCRPRPGWEMFISSPEALTSKGMSQSRDRLRRLLKEKRDERLGIEEILPS